MSTIWKSRVKIPAQKNRIDENLIRLCVCLSAATCCLFSVLFYLWNKGGSDSYNFSSESDGKTETEW